MDKGGQTSPAQMQAMPVRRTGRPTTPDHHTPSSLTDTILTIPLPSSLTFVTMSLPPTQRDTPCSRAAKPSRRTGRLPTHGTLPFPQFSFHGPNSQSLPSPRCQVPVPHPGRHPLLKFRPHQPEQQVGKLRQDTLLDQRLCQPPEL